MQTTSALGTAALAHELLPTFANAAPRSPNERLRVGIIGVAGRGESNWTGVAAAGADIVAVCDVDEQRTGKIRETYPKATFYTDFRKLLEQRTSTRSSFRPPTTRTL